MRRIKMIKCGLGLVCISASALNINLQPGGMNESYADLRNTEDAILVLSGSADVRDLALLKNMSESVKTVDMSALSIAAYTFTDGDYMGRTSFEAGEIPPYMMTGATVNSIILPSTCRVIGESAFVASQIESIEFPQSLEKVSDFAFANADRLKSAHFKNKVTFGIGVFKDCDLLSDVVIDYAITSIPESMFDGCVSFKSEIPASVSTVGAFAYRGTALESVDLSNITEIGNYSFADMKNLSSIIMDATGNLKMGKGAFFNDGALELLPVFESDLSQTAFAHTSGNMKNVIQSANIGAGAYANNSDMDTVVFGPAVKYIGSHAFRNNSALDLVDVEQLGTSMPEVEADAFSGLANSEGRYDIKLNVEEGTEDTWNAHPVWSLFNVGHYTVGVDDIVAGEGVSVSVRKEGLGVYVGSTHDIDYVGVFSVNGMVLHEAAPASMSYSIAEIPASEVVVVKVISGGISKIVKLK